MTNIDCGDNNLTTSNKQNIQQQQEQQEQEQQQQIQQQIQQKKQQIQQQIQQIQQIQQQSEEEIQEEQEEEEKQEIKIQNENFNLEQNQNRFEIKNIMEEKNIYYVREDESCYNQTDLNLIETEAINNKLNNKLNNKTIIKLLDKPQNIDKLLNPNSVKNIKLINKDKLKITEKEKKVIKQITENDLNLMLEDNFFKFAAKKKFISLNETLKWFIDANIMGKFLNRSHIDVTFYKIKKKKLRITFEEFLLFLEEIVIKYMDETWLQGQEALNHLKYKLSITSPTFHSTIPDITVGGVDRLTEPKFYTGIQKNKFKYLTNKKGFRSYDGWLIQDEQIKKKNE